MNNSTNQIIVFDTTLRDGQQAPGYAMTPSGKMAVARTLQDLKVDVIEAGYAISSQDDEKAIHDIAQEIRRPIICSLSMCRDDSIEAAARALEPAEKSRIHLYIGLSPEHRKAREMSPVQVIDKAVAAVRKAAHYFSDIQFSPEDATRTEFEWLIRIANAVYEEGARTFNVPDTVGFMTPQKIERFFRSLYEKIPAVRSGDYVLSTHTHNDKGLALANGLHSVIGGARQMEGTLLGIGERAGNMATEQGIMAITLDRQDFESPFGIPAVDHIDLKQIYPACRSAAEATHHPIPKNQPHVGDNAFGTEAGTHVHLLKESPKTYYLYDSTMIGRGAPEVILGSQSGRSALFTYTSELGYPVPKEMKAAYYDKFKKYADSKRDSGGSVSAQELLDQVYFPIMIEVTGGPYIVRVDEDRNRVNDRIGVTIFNKYGADVRGCSAPQGGSIDAVQSAFKKIMPDVDIINLNVISAGEGSAAKARATVTMKNDWTVSSSVDHQDTRTATLQAQLDAFNRLCALHHHKDTSDKDGSAGTK